MSNAKNPAPPDPCPHLADFRSCTDGPNPFIGLLKYRLIRAKPMGHAAFRRHPNEVPRCDTCDSMAPSRLYACATCFALHCHAPSPSPSHAAAHAESMPPGHEIAVDVDRVELFCCRCLDQVYDAEFDAAVIGDLIPPSQKKPLPKENPRKRRLVDYSEKVLMSQNCGSSREHDPDCGGSGSGSGHPPGLRGLTNMGSTCFMNSVLQALLHTPPLRNFFLCDDKRVRLCCARNKRVTRSLSRGEEIKMACLTCDLDAVFSAAFSGDRSPYNPAQFLYSWWQHATDLASYEQQDAHECFFSLLDGIHSKVVKERQEPQSEGSGDCCIAHKVFAGILQSDVICLACGFTSTKYDPCVDIPLDLQPEQLEKKSSKKSHQPRNAESGSTDSMHTCCSATLKGCLDHFTRAERLGTEQKMFCEKCQERQESLKQMSIRKLPLVSCFHIKRFQYCPIRNVLKKVDRYLQFPFSLDMAPYLSSSILRSRYGNRLFSCDGGEPAGQEDLSSEFELFAVITHTGSLHAGHYVTYLRLRNRWYKCDDAWITQVSDSILMASQGYMMFYVQKMIYDRENVAAPVS